VTRRLEITVSDELLARLDAARGHEPRASFIKRALERALGPEAKDTPVPGVERPAAPPRASEALPARGRVVDRAALERQAKLNKAREKKS
jgi:hypothetical protein